MATQTQQRGPSVWAWIGGIAAGGIIVGGGAWFVHRTWFKKTAIPPKDAPTPPAGTEIIACELYKGRTLCVLRDKNAPTPPFEYLFNVDGGAPPSSSLYGSSKSALEEGKKWIDALPKIPSPDLDPLAPVTEPDGSPVAVGEPGDGGGFTVGVTATGATNHGLQVTFGEGNVCQTFKVLDADTWRAWAAGLVEGMNLTIWDAQDIADRVYEETFPPCGEHLSQIEGVTINGMSYGDVVAQMQAWLSGFNGGTIELAPGESWPDILAGLLIGEPYIPPSENPAAQVPQFDLGAGGSVHKVPGPGGQWTIVLTIEKVTNPAVGATLTFIRWRLWQPGAILELGNETRTGTVPAEAGNPGALAAASAAIPAA